MPDKFNITTSDKQLVEATLQGDISSFGIIVERYWDMVIAFALSKINNATDAEDIAQESLLKAYSQLHRLRNPSCSIGNEYCRLRLRRSKFRQDVFFTGTQAQFSSTAKGMIFRDTEGIALRVAV